MAIAERSGPRFTAGEILSAAQAILRRDFPDVPPEIAMLFMNKLSVVAMGHRSIHGLTHDANVGSTIASEVIQAKENGFLSFALLNKPGSRNQCDHLAWLTFSFAGQFQF